MPHGFNSATTLANNYVVDVPRDTPPVDTVYPFSAPTPSSGLLPPTSSPDHTPAPGKAPWTLELLLAWLAGCPSSPHHPPLVTRHQPLLILCWIFISPLSGHRSAAAAGNPRNAPVYDISCVASAAAPPRSPTPRHRATPAAAPTRSPTPCHRATPAVARTKFLILRRRATPAAARTRFLVLRRRATPKTAPSSSLTPRLRGACAHLATRAPPRPELRRVRHH